MRRNKKPQNINEEIDKIKKLISFNITQNSHDVLSEQNTGPNLDDCDWFWMEVYYVDNQKGELHAKRISRGNWQLEKYSDEDNIENLTIREIKIPQVGDIKVKYDKSLKLLYKLDVDSTETKNGIDAYNVIFPNDSKTAEDLTLVYDSTVYPSKYAITRDYEYINVGMVRKFETKEKPVGLTNEISMREFKKGTAINISDTYVVKRGLGKKTYLYFELRTTKKGEAFGSGMTNCDKSDSDNAGKH